MKQMGRKLILSLGIALASMGSSSLRADVAYTLIADYGKSGAFKGVTRSAELTTYSKPGKKREETTITISASNIKTNTSKSITITLCDKQKVYELDDKRKVYYVHPLLSTMTNLGIGKPGASGNTGGEGRLDATIKVQAMGTEKIGDFTAKHAMITMNMQESGCIGSSNRTTKMEIWTAPIKVFVCPEMMTPTHTSTNPNGCKITIENHGDLKALVDVYSGMTVRQTVYQGDRAVMTYELKNYSEKSLDDSLFDIPAGYKEVSQSEFTNLGLKR